MELDDEANKQQKISAAIEKLKSRVKKREDKESLLLLRKDGLEEEVVALEKLNALTIREIKQ
jgi:hypothetical protein